MPAFGARAQLLTVRILTQNGRQILDYVCNMEEAFVELVATLTAVPNKPIELVSAPLTFDNESDGVGEALRRMRNERRQHENFTFANLHIRKLPVLYGPQQHVALDLIEQFRSGIDVIVRARVRPADDHHYEFGARVDFPVGHRGLQKVAVILDPLCEIERRQNRHIGNRYRFVQRLCLAGTAGAADRALRQRLEHFTRVRGWSRRFSFMAVSRRPHTQPLSRAVRFSACIVPSADQWPK